MGVNQLLASDDSTLGPWMLEHLWGSLLELGMGLVPLVLYVMLVSIIIHRNVKISFMPQAWPDHHRLRVCSVFSSN